MCGESSEYPRGTCVLDILGMSLLKYKGGARGSDHLDLRMIPVLLLREFFPLSMGCVCTQ